MLRCMGMDVTEAEVSTIMKELDKNGGLEGYEKEFVMDWCRRRHLGRQIEERLVKSVNLNDHSLEN